MSLATGKINQIFDALDADKSGCINREEFQEWFTVDAAVTRVRSKPEYKEAFGDVETAFKLLDVDQDNKITLPELSKFFSSFSLEELASIASNLASVEKIRIQRLRSNPSKPIVCRCCQGPTPDGTKNPITFCAKTECQEAAETFCGEALSCGHACNGVKGEGKHLPCLNAVCIEKAKAAGAETDVYQSDDSDCPICQEELGTGACVRVDSCNHVLHARCLTSLVKSISHPQGQRIKFTLCGCPFCHKWISHPSVAEDMKAHLALRAQLEADIKERNKVEKYDEHAKVTTPGSPFFQNFVDFCLVNLSYYFCSKCQKPFYGGTVQCDAAGAELDRPASELLCLSCQPQDAHPCKDIEHAMSWVWKCRFCCTEATFCCFGNVHFCQSCHDQAGPRLDGKVAGQEDTYPCPPTGKETCSLPFRAGQTTHKNGTGSECEQVLRCLVCDDPEAKRQAVSNPMSANLVPNPHGEEGKAHWKIDGPIDFENDRDPTTMPAGAKTNFVTSYSMGSRSMVVDLLRPELGVTQELLDSKPEIEVAGWYTGRTDAGSIYHLNVKLLDANRKPIAPGFSKNYTTCPAWAKASVTFKDYAAGVPRFVEYKDGGKDTCFWAGWYGAKFTNATVQVKLSK